jgi:predicted transcriptional regulator
MDVRFSPEIEAEIIRRAAVAGKAPAEVVEELISHTLNDEARFLEAIEQGFAELDSGEFVTHQEVGKRIERLFRSPS